MNTKQISIRVDEQTRKAIKLAVVQGDTTLQEWLTKAIQEKLKER